jgi:hypothetical protein
MGKVPFESDGDVPQVDAAGSNSPVEAPQGEQPAEQIDIAGALLEHLKAPAAAVPQLGSAGEGSSDVAEDLLPAALQDLAAHNIEQALDQLTASPDLFDLPPLDFGGDSGFSDS